MPKMISNTMYLLLDSREVLKSVLSQIGEQKFVLSVQA